MGCTRGTSAGTAGSLRQQRRAGGRFQSSETAWQNCKSMTGCMAFIERPDESLCMLFSFTYELTFLLGPRLGND